MRLSPAPFPVATVTKTKLNKSPDFFIFVFLFQLWATLAMHNEFGCVSVWCNWDAGSLNQVKTDACRFAGIKSLSFFRLDWCALSATHIISGRSSHDEWWGLSCTGVQFGSWRQSASVEYFSGRSESRLAIRLLDGSTIKNASYRHCSKKWSSWCSQILGNTFTMFAQYAYYRYTAISILNRTISCLFRDFGFVCLAQIPFCLTTWTAVSAFMLIR